MMKLLCVLATRCHVSLLPTRTILATCERTTNTVIAAQAPVSVARRSGTPRGLQNAEDRAALRCSSAPATSVAFGYRLSVLRSSLDAHYSSGGCDASTIARYAAPIQQSPARSARPRRPSSSTFYCGNNKSSAAPLTQYYSYRSFCLIIPVVAPAPVRISRLSGALAAHSSFSSSREGFLPHMRRTRRDQNQKHYKTKSRWRHLRPLALSIKSYSTINVRECRARCYRLTPGYRGFDSRYWDNGQLSLHRVHTLGWPEDLRDIYGRILTISKRRVKEKKFSLEGCSSAVTNRQDPQN
ncbi:hypothetical protein EVAR_64194_1 [Eumeta japonica]|uniref:Uncharacterized protein n=1 Tax=Eumeta variegata TaxID=151549 RepID=A0A4C1ZL66_EUMVA|nr:hypothetical protein EVAR_64194_1 [Eumeta japonica]